jgi:hypothetical protein
MAPVLPLRFSIDLYKHLRKHKYDHSAIGGVIPVIVVAHVTMRRVTKNSYIRDNTRGIPRHARDNTLLSSADINSPFTHERYNNTTQGKILHFRLNQNLIRAGKRTYPDAIRSIYFQRRWFKEDGWHTGIAAPNMVVTGRFSKPVDNRLLSHPHATKPGDSFPGISIRVPDAKACTPSIFINADTNAQSTFIIPGITNIKTLVAGLNKLQSVVTEACPDRPMLSLVPARSQVDFGS